MICHLLVVGKSRVAWSPAKVRAHGESRGLSVAPWVFRERGEVPAGGQFFGSVFSDCGGVQPRHRLAPVGVAGQMVEEEPPPAGPFSVCVLDASLWTARANVSQSNAASINMLLVPSGHADKVADGVE